MSAQIRCHYLFFSFLLTSLCCFGLSTCLCGYVLIVLFLCRHNVWPCVGVSLKAKALCCGVRKVLDAALEKNKKGTLSSREKQQSMRWLPRANFSFAAELTCADISGPRFN